MGNNLKAAELWGGPLEVSCMSACRSLVLRDIATEGHTLGADGVYDTESRNKFLEFCPENEENNHSVCLCLSDTNRLCLTLLTVPTEDREACRP